jgi:outer membrane protein TolC
MRLREKIALLSGLFVGCATAPEQPALQVWQRQEQQLQESEPTTLGADAGLTDYTRYAQWHNPGLKRAFMRWKSALERVAPARALADPRLTYGYFVRHVETRVGPQEMRFGAAQTFPWKGTLDLKGRIALQGAEVERQRYEMARRDLVFRVVAAYYDYYYLERAFFVTEGNLWLLAYLEEVARARYRGGIGAHEAVLKAQVELGRLEDRLRGLREMRRPATARLNAALGRSILAAVTVPDSLPLAAFPFAQEELVARLQTTNPRLQLSLAQSEAAALEAELAGKRRYPDLTLAVDYIRTGEARLGASPVDNGKDPLVAMASINLPIQRESYRAQERAAAANHRAALYSHQDEVARLTAELELVLYKRRDAEGRAALYRDSLLPKAEQALNVAQQAFAAGRSDFLSVIDAHRALLEFQLAYERARTDQALYLAEIEKLAGASLIAEEDKR